MPPASATVSSSWISADGDLSMTAPLAGADDLTRGPLTDPSPFYHSRDQLYADDMFIAAVNGFDFFTWLDAHPSSIQEIARRFGFHERPVDVMTTLFVAR